MTRQSEDPLRSPLGTRGYSVNGYTREQLVGVMDQYERHMSYLHLLPQAERTPADISDERGPQDPVARPGAAT